VKLNSIFAPRVLAVIESLTRVRAAARPAETLTDAMTLIRDMHRQKGGSMESLARRVEDLEYACQSLRTQVQTLSLRCVECREQLQRLRHEYTQANEVIMELKSKGEL
jgi:chromosome segregation ATPase